MGLTPNKSCAEARKKSLVFSIASDVSGSHPQNEDHRKRGSVAFQTSGNRTGPRLVSVHGHQSHLRCLGKCIFPDTNLGLPRAVWEHPRAAITCYHRRGLKQKSILLQFWRL